MSTGMAPTWAFLIVVFVALTGFALAFGVFVMLFRAANRTGIRPPGTARPGDDGHAFIPPVIGDDSLTNPAHPLYHLHHPASSAHDPAPHPSADHSHSPPAFDATPSSSPSFDSGSGVGSSFDSGSSAMGSDSGANCG